MIMFIFKFILLLFIALFLFILIFAFRILNYFRNGMNQFNKQNGNNEGRGRHGRNSSYGDDEKVIDTRNPEDANKKIFTKDEGEYVDYTEEDK